eukprot:c19814_g1_i3.p1 GENE.c19814_g1_i3~~c19814_g1_i3.p1  ORF type:complete len:110 (+),score=10.81 c19814_g1_i3:314-643(+)
MLYHPGALDCARDRLWDCRLSRPCECDMPWANVEQCRPLKKIPPKRCPVVCKNDAYPWKHVCVKSCWCPGCAAPVCENQPFWFALVCRKYCVCQAQCDAPEALKLDETL